MNLLDFYQSNRIMPQQEPVTGNVAKRKTDANTVRYGGIPIHTTHLGDDHNIVELIAGDIFEIG